jgi:ferredoxin
LSIKKNDPGKVLSLGKDARGNDVYALSVKGERGMVYRLVNSFLGLYGIGENELSLVDSGAGDNFYLLAGLLFCRFHLLASFETLKAVGKQLAGLTYRMQVGVMDCMGCGVCANVCPSKEKALVMKPFGTQLVEAENWDYAMRVSIKDNLWNKFSVKGSQFAQPLLEFSGACGGCVETTYAKLVTQLFGDRMIVTNATGCSSIWGGSAPSMPY